MKRITEKIMYVSSLLLFSSVVGFFIIKSSIKKMDKDYREMIVNVCNQVDYNYPGQVSSVSELDINNDNLPDITLTLKDESRLEYLSKGYELKK